MDVGQEPSLLICRPLTEASGRGAIFEQLHMSTDGKICVWVCVEEGVANTRTATVTHTADTEKDRDWAGVSWSDEAPGAWALIFDFTNPRTEEIPA